MSLVCLDSHYFRWGILRTASPGQEDMIPQAEEFFKFLEGIDATILVPTVIVTELLMRSDPSERHKILTTLEGNFHVAEYDTLCAKYAADVWNQKKRSGVINDIQTSDSRFKAHIKVDTQILGTALAHNADILYTHDTGLQKLADGLIIVKDMPSFDIQSDFMDALENQGDTNEERDS